MSEIHRKFHSLSNLSNFETRIQFPPQRESVDERESEVLRNSQYSLRAIIVCRFIGDNLVKYLANNTLLP